MLLGTAGLCVAYISPMAIGCVKYLVGMTDTSPYTEQYFIHSVNTYRH